MAGRRPRPVELAFRQPGQRVSATTNAASSSGPETRSAPGSMTMTPSVTPAAIMDGDGELMPLFLLVLDHERLLGSPGAALRSGWARSAPHGIAIAAAGSSDRDREGGWGYMGGVLGERGGSGSNDAAAARGIGCYRPLKAFSIMFAAAGTRNRE